MNTKESKHKFRPKDGAYVGFAAKYASPNGVEYVVLTRTRVDADKIAAEVCRTLDLDHAHVGKCELRAVKP